MIVVKLHMSTSVKQKEDWLERIMHVGNGHYSKLSGRHPLGHGACHSLVTIVNAVAVGAATIAQQQHDKRRQQQRENDNDKGTSPKQRRSRHTLATTQSRLGAP